MAQYRPQADHGHNDEIALPGNEAEHAPLVSRLEDSLQVLVYNPQKTKMVNQQRQYKPHSSKDIVADSVGF